MSTTKLTAAELTSIFGGHFVRGSDYPFASVDVAFRLSEKLGLTWPSHIHAAFAEAREARDVVKQISISENITYDLLTSDNAAQRVRDIMNARLLGEGIHRITGEISQAVTSRLTSLLPEAAPGLLTQLVEYADKHVDDLRYTGLTGRLPEDLQTKKQVWPDIRELHRALFQLQYAEKRIGETLPTTYDGWCYTYEWEPEHFLEFLELYGGTPSDENMIEYALNRGMTPNLALTKADLISRAEPLDRAVQARDKARKEATANNQFAARPSPHVYAAPGGTGTQERNSTQLLNAYEHGMNG